MVSYKRQWLFWLLNLAAIDFEEPIFGQIQEIYVVYLAVYFYIQILETTDYCEHYCRLSAIKPQTESGRVCLQTTCMGEVKRLLQCA
jgi:hypothetical protein